MKEIHRRNAPDIFFLMEIKNPTEVVLDKLQWLHPDQYVVVPPEMPGSGGLFLTWKPDIKLEVLKSSKNFIDTTITHKGVIFHATFVYGEPDNTKRQSVWEEMTKLQINQGEPWLLTGDFNEIIDNNEKCGEPDRAEGTFCAFRTFLSHNDLFDLKHSGSYLSWRGKRHSHLVQCRLDRWISNSEWIELFPSC